MGRGPIRRWLPTKEKLLGMPGIRRFAPQLAHASLWRVNRRAVSIGVSVGVFFGFLIPFAQIPASVLFAVLMRANVPAAALCTFVTNPFTTLPIYYAAFQCGRWIESLWTAALVQSPSLEMLQQQSFPDLLKNGGATLVIGLAVVAAISSLLAYVAVNLSWRVNVIRRRNRIHSKRVTQTANRSS
jgi:uncharacterized protein